MDRYTFLAGQPFLISLPSSQWPPAVANTTSEIIFRGFCCFQDCEENYLFFRPAPPSAADPSQLSIELGIVKPKGPSSSDTTTDGNELQGATQNALHVCIDGRCYAIHYAAILQIEVDSDDTALPPSFTMCFEDVNMKLYVTPGSRQEHQAAAEGIAQTVDSLVRGFQGKAASPGPATEEHRGSDENLEAGTAMLAEKTQAWERLVDTALGLSVVMIRGEGEVGPEGLSRLMDETAVQLTTATVRGGERAQLHAATTGARQDAENRLEEALADFVADGTGTHALVTGATEAVSERMAALRSAYEAQVWGELLPVGHPPG